MGIRNRQKDFLLNYVGGVQLSSATPVPEQRASFLESMGSGL